MSTTDTRLSLTEAELDAIGRRANAATQGPWGWGYDDGTRVIVLPTVDASPGFGAGTLGVAPVDRVGDDIASSRLYGSTWAPAIDPNLPDDHPFTDTLPPPLDEWTQGQNARFIAAARTDVPRLLAEVRRLRQEESRRRTDLEQRYAALLADLEGGLHQIARWTSDPRARAETARLLARLARGMQP